MFRKTLALLIRALRVDARSLRPHLIRLGLLATILWLLYLASWQASFMGAPGLQLFSGLTVTNTWFITIVGVTYFASAITEEKEERTLGLLRMADIGGASILLGKWLPRMIGMLSLIVVQFPFTLLAITLGGVTAGQVNAVYVALLLLLVSVGTYSLLFSVICRNTGTAVRLTFIVLLLRWVIPLLAGGIATQVGGGFTVLDGIAALRRASIFHLTARALSPAFMDGPFPIEAAWWLGESLLVLALAWLLFEPCTQADVTTETQPSVWSRLTTRKQRSHQRRAWQAAIVGKDFMLLAGGFRGSILRLAVYLAIVIGFAWFPSMWGGPLSLTQFGGMLFSFGIGFLILDVIQSAAKVFRVELQDQTWSALMMLPWGINSIAWSKIGGCAVGWWPSLSMIFVGGLLVPTAVASFIEGLTSPEAFFFFMFFVAQVVIFLELTVLTSISLSWAAWPLAAPLSFCLVVMSNVLLFTCVLSTIFGGGSEGVQVMMFLLNGVSLAVIAVLYRRIGARLMDKASDGA